MYSAEIFGHHSLQHVIDSSIVNFAFKIFGALIKKESMQNPRTFCSTCKVHKVKTFSNSYPGYHGEAMHLRFT